MDSRKYELEPSGFSGMNFIIPHGFEANYTLGFTKGLAANGVDLCVVSCDETAERLNMAGIRNLNLRGSHSYDRPIAAKVSVLLRYYYRLLTLLWRHRGATVHFTGIFRHELILFEGIVLNLCFRLLAGRYIYTVHNVLPHGRGRSRFLGNVYRLLYRIPHVLLVHTPRVRQQLVKEFGVPDAKIRVTSIGLNEEVPLSGLTRAQARERLGFGDRKQLLLFFGKMDEYKGVDLLVDAFSRVSLPDSELVLVGTFRSNSYREVVLEQLKRAERRDGIHLVERFIPNEEVEVFFKACDVLCLPYRNIYQSGLIFLALRFGIPMVTTDVGSLREFVEGGMGLVSRTNDAAGIAEAIETFFSQADRFRREEIIARAQKYRWDLLCRDLLPLYSTSQGGALNAGVTEKAVPGSSESPSRSLRDRC